jgi:hypothetical protein
MLGRAEEGGVPGRGDKYVCAERKTHHSLRQDNVYAVVEPGVCVRARACVCVGA